MKGKILMRQPFFAASEVIKGIVRAGASFRSPGSVFFNNYYVPALWRHVAGVYSTPPFGRLSSVGYFLTKSTGRLQST